MTRIAETANYERFELLAFNRNLGKTRDLEASMQKYGWIEAYPMHVVKGPGGVLQIKAGHHRFEVARRLGLPVKFVVCEDRGESVHELEQATTRWSLRDFLTSYVRLGAPHYLAVQKFHEDTGLTLLQCINLVAGDSAGSNNQTVAFKTGEYQAGDPTHAQHVAEVVLGCAHLRVPFARKALFVQAVSAVCRVPEFDRRLFLDRVESHPGLMVPQPLKQAYIELIERVYNYGSKSRRLLFPLAFRAKEEADARNVGRVREPAP